jgi:hypothetical protein
MKTGKGEILEKEVDYNFCINICFSSFLHYLCENFLELRVKN